MDEKVKELLEELEADGFRDGYDWKGFHVIVPIYDGEPIIGLPYVILQNETTARISTPEESLEYLDYDIKQMGRKAEEY